MTRPARIPADVNRPDRVLGPFTARQAVLLLATAAVLYSAWTGLRAWCRCRCSSPSPSPVAAFAVVVALGQRDGLPLDRFLLAALRHHLNPRRHPARHPRRRQPLDPASPAAPACRPGRTAHAPRADRRLRRGRARPGCSPRPSPRPASGRDPAGPGCSTWARDGLVAIAVVSTINFGLRTPAEQDALVAGFARYLHTLDRAGAVPRSAPSPVDLGEPPAAPARAGPHPAPSRAGRRGRGHRAHLAHLAPTG